tara:strand:+ start:409 stop:774 length:366 start_codon:yes stop_codon:yes gene_type:complete
MAEGIAKKYLNDCTIKSAGTNPEPINPLAIEVMNEIGIDLSNHYSKTIKEEQIKLFDIAITLCGDAKDKCINLHNLVKEHIHWDIIDPAKADEMNNDKLAVFRNVRNQIKNNIKILNQKIG